MMSKNIIQKHCNISTNENDANTIIEFSPSTGRRLEFWFVFVIYLFIYSLLFVNKIINI